MVLTLSFRWIFLYVFFLLIYIKIRMNYIIFNNQGDYFMYLPKIMKSSWAKSDSRNADQWLLGVLRALVRGWFGQEVALWGLTLFFHWSKAKFKSPCNFQELPYVARIFLLVIYFWYSECKSSHTVYYIDFTQKWRDFIKTPVFLLSNIFDCDNVKK